jgi:6-phosphofructokinase 1
MGRYTGWIALEAGIAGGADIILIPEIAVDMTEVCESLRNRHKRGKTFSIVVVSEGVQVEGRYSIKQDDHAVDEFGHRRFGGIAELIAQTIENNTGYETRVSVLGHIQRGGTPTAYDRVIGTRFGVRAVELVKENQLGKMVSLRGNQMKAVSIEEAVTTRKTVDMDLFEIAKVFFAE